MSKKDKKIEIQLSDAKVVVGKDKFAGYTLTIGKKLIGEIAELDDQFAIIKNGNVDSFYSYHTSFHFFYFTRNSLI